MDFPDRSGDIRNDGASFRRYWRISLGIEVRCHGIISGLGKNPESGAEVGLSYAFLSHTLQLFIMLSMGLISIPLLAKARKI